MSGPAKPVLRAWKEIADYLGRDVRTAIRWEKEKGLPVHRERGRSHARVFAYPSEIDAWLRGDGPGTPARPAPDESPLVGTLRQLGRFAAIALGVVLAALALLALSSAGGESDLSLEFARTDLATAPKPHWITRGDLNRDGHDDLVITSEGTGELQLWLGDGKGSFHRGASLAVGANPMVLASGDFDSDGHLDLAVSVRSDGSLKILRGQPDGSLQLHSTVDLGYFSKGIAVGDLNGDQVPDLAVSIARRGVVLLLGRGDATFQESARLPDQGPGGLVLADFDQDQRLDLAVTEFVLGTGDAVLVYRGRGDGTMQDPVRCEVTGAPLGVSAADLNHDGYLDLVVGRFRGGVAVLLGKGGGTFQSAVLYPAGRGNGEVLIVDLDGDGVLDVAASGMHSNDISVLRGTGDGRLHPGVEFAAGSYADAMSLGDFDHDGRPDLAVTNAISDSVSVFLNRSHARSAGWKRLRRIASLLPWNN